MKKKRRFLAIVLTLAMLVSELQFVRADEPDPAAVYTLAVANNAITVNGEDVTNILYGVEYGGKLSIADAYLNSSVEVVYKSMDGEGTIRTDPSDCWQTENGVHKYTICSGVDLDLSNSGCWKMDCTSNGGKITGITFTAINTEIVTENENDMPTVIGDMAYIDKPYYIPGVNSKIYVCSLVDDSTERKTFAGWKYKFAGVDYWSALVPVSNVTMNSEEWKVSVISTTGHVGRLLLKPEWRKSTTPQIVDTKTTSYRITYMVDGVAVTGEDCGSNPATVEEGTTVNLNIPTKEHYTFDGWYTSEEMKEESKVTSITPDEHMTLYGSWKYTGSTYKVGVASMKDIETIYGATGKEMQGQLKANTTLKLDVVKQGEGLTRAVNTDDWKGAVWFYAKGEASLAANETCATLRDSTEWKVLSEGDVLSAGLYSVALAFDKNQFDKNGDVVEAGAVAVAKLKVEKQPVTLQLSMAKDESTGFLLDEATTFNPAKDLVVKVFDAKKNVLPITFESFSLVTKAGDKVTSDKAVTFSELAKMTDYQFYISKDVWEAGDVKLNEKFNKANYELKDDSNIIDLVCLGDNVQMKLEEGTYYKNLYALNDEALKNLDFADYFKVEYVEGENKTSKYDNIGSIRWYVSTDDNEESRQKAAATYFQGKGKSVTEQLKELAETPKNLSAGATWYVTAYNDRLKLSSEKAITIKKQPIVLVNAEEIKGIKKAGLQKGVGGVNEEGNYKGKIKVGLLDKTGKIVLNEEPANDLDVKDYSDKYTALLGKGLGDLTALSTWTNLNNVKIDFAKIGENPEFLYGPRPITLVINGFGEEIEPLLQANFELSSDRNYSCYSISDSRTLKMRDMEGQQLYYIENNIKVPVEVIGEVTEVKQKDGSIKKVAEFTVNPLYFAEDEETLKEDATEAEKKALEEKKKNRTKKAKWYLQDEQGHMTVLKEDEVEPLGKEETYDGVKFTLDADAYGEVIPVNADFGQTKNKKIAWCKKDENFYVVYIPSVVYTSEYLVARDDTKAASHKNKNGVLDVKVFYGNKQLTIGDDYTLTYRNNVNAACSTDRSAPAVKVKGKGTYRGLTTSYACFTILPARLDQLAKVTISNQFVKSNTGKDMSKLVKMQVVNKITNKKIKSGSYDIKVFEYSIDETSGKILKRAEAEWYDPHDDVRYLDVVAVAKPKDKNFIPGSTFGEELQVGDNLFDNLDRVDVISIPKSSKKLSVKGIKKSLGYAENLKPSDFVDLITSTAKIGKTTFFLNNPQIDVNLYKDNQWICGKKDWNATILKDSGEYQIKVGPVMNWKDEKGNNHSESSLIQYGVFEPTVVKVQIKKMRFNKNMLKLLTEKCEWTSEAPVLKFKIKSMKFTDRHKKQIRFCVQKIVSDSVTVGDYIYYTGSTSKAESIPLTIGGKEILFSDLKNNELDLRTVDDIGIDFSAPGKYQLILDADSIDGELYDAASYTYTVSAVKLNKGLVQDGIVKIETKQSYAYNPAGHDYDTVSVSLKSPKGDYVTLEPGIDYTLTWKDSEIGGNGGKVKVTGTGSKISNSYAVSYDVTQANFSETETYIEGVTEPVGDKIYYMEYSKKRGAKKVASELMQFAKFIDKNGQCGYKQIVLKSGVVYTVSIQPETEEATEGSALVEAKSVNSPKYTGFYTMKYKLYNRDIKKVEMSLANDGKVYINSEEGRQLAEEALPGSEGVGIKITKLVITFKEGGNATETIEGWENIKEACDILYSNNTVARENTTKVSIRFKDGTKYDTMKTYSTKYTITVTD